MNYMESKNLYQRLISNSSRFLNKIDEYNESRLFKVSKKIKYTLETSSALGLNPITVTGIVIGDELTRTAYGEVGEKFLREKDPNFSRIDFAKRIMSGIIEGYDSEQKDKILEGMDHLEDRKDSTAEQKLAYMLIDGFNYAEGLDTEPKRDICFINYKNRIMTYSKKEKKLAGPTVPVLENPREKKRKIDEKQALKVLDTVFEQYKSKKIEIPSDSEKGLEGLDEDARIAYYIVSLPEKELEKISGLGVFTKDKDDYRTYDD